MESRITSRDVADMARHWLACPPNGYLGSGYGSPIDDLLQTPMASSLADDLIAKAKQDIPLLVQAPAGAVNVYSYDDAMDRKVIAFDIGGNTIQLQRDSS